MNKTQTSESTFYDLLIVGGGINGTGMAAAAAERGLKVLLCEQSDLASATSSASSKLIHGGLRYLEHYEFRLVREALAEREVLLEKAPHLVWPQEFVLPHSSQLRPAWMIRLGLFFYDNLSPRSQIPPSRKIKLVSDGITQKQFKTGFSYYDCSVDDSRLVISSALSAKANSADILPRTQCVSAKPKHNGWELRLKNQHQRDTFLVEGHCLINASGPWAQTFLEHNLGIPSPQSIRLIKGSHILVPRCYTGEHAYILQNPDRRIVFVIPYLNKFSLIGTTDEAYEGDPSSATISTAETDYLIASVNRYFRKAIKTSDIIGSYSGLRPLCDDESVEASAVTRDYTLELQAVSQQPLLSVFGGKITTYRRLAESALLKLSPYLPHMHAPLPANTALPGGEFKQTDWPNLKGKVAQQAPFLSTETQQRLARSYGLRCFIILDEVNKLEDLGHHFGCGLYEREVEYLVNHEWAHNSEDILWRRTKLGYFFSTDEKTALEQYLSKGRF